MTTPDQRLFIERSLASQSADISLSPSDSVLWHTAGFTARTLCHYDKIFVVWRQFLDKPEVIDSIHVRDVDVTTKDGFAVCVETDTDEQWITHMPSRIGNHHIFCHVPYLTDITYMPGPNPDKMVLRFPLVFKTASNPRFLVEGDVYVSQLSEFRTTYPEHKDLKL